MNLENSVARKILIFVFILLFTVPTFAESDIIRTEGKGPVAYGSKAYAPLAQQIIDEPLGSIVTFGHFEQDGYEANGKEPVEWILLDRDYTDNSAILISLYLLDCLRFDGFSRPVTWETSSLRGYMNTKMYDELFDDEEKKCVKKSLISTMDNFYNGEDSGNNTYDYLYLPGMEDILLYFSNKNFVNDALLQELLRPNPLRQAVGTPYAIARGLRTTSATHEYPLRGNYFLRTKGLYGHRIWYNDVYADYFQAYISELGEIKPDGTGVDSMDDGIRPMVRVYF